MLTFRCVFETINVQLEEKMKKISTIIGIFGLLFISLFISETAYGSYDIVIGGSTVTKEEIQQMIDEIPREQCNESVTITMEDQEEKVVAVGEDWSNAFANLPTYTGRIDLSNLDTSGITNMSSMFADNLYLSELRTSGWDTSNVTNMSGMFEGVGVWSPVYFYMSDMDTSNVTNMSKMFRNSSAVIDFSLLNTSNVTDMSNMFESYMYGWGGDISLDLSSFDTEKVINMREMFKDAQDVKYYNLSNFDTSGVLDMSGMFKETLSKSRDTLIVTGDKKLKEYDYKSDGHGLLGTVKTDAQYAVFFNKMTESPLFNSYTIDQPLNETVIQNQLDLKQKELNLTTNNFKFKRWNSENDILPDLNIAFSYTAEFEEVIDNKLFPDKFKLGIDDFVTGTVTEDSTIKKVQLYVNDLLISSNKVYSDNSFEIDTENTILTVDDKVEVVGLNRSSKEVERQTVFVEKEEFQLFIDDFSLYETEAITGDTDVFHTEVALFINGEEVERIYLLADRLINFGAVDDIEYLDDDVEVVGYKYGQEITRTKVNLSLPTNTLESDNYFLSKDTFITGKVTGKAAKKVRLYVNRKRQQTVTISEDGSFRIQGNAITSEKDQVDIAVLTEKDQEIGRYGITIISDN